MKPKVLRRIIASCLPIPGLAMAAGCAGGAQSAPPASGAGPQPVPQTQQAMGTVVLTVVVPRKATTLKRSAGRAPEYLGFGTQSMAVNLNNGAYATIVSCFGYACTVTIPAPAGNPLFSVKFYDQNASYVSTYGSGFNLLSEFNGPITVVANNQNNISVQASAVVNGGSLNLNPANHLSTGYATTTVALTTHDARGNWVNGQFANPVAITISTDRPSYVTMSLPAQTVCNMPAQTAVPATGTITVCDTSQVLSVSYLPSGGNPTYINVTAQAQHYNDAAAPPGGSTSSNVW